MLVIIHQKAVWVRSQKLVPIEKIFFGQSTKITRKIKRKPGSVFLKNKVNDQYLDSKLEVNQVQLFFSYNFTFINRTAS